MCVGVGNSAFCSKCRICLNLKFGPHSRYKREFKQKIHNTFYYVICCIQCHHRLFMCLISFSFWNRVVPFSHHRLWCCCCCCYCVFLSIVWKAFLVCIHYIACFSFPVKANSLRFTNETLTYKFCNSVKQKYQQPTQMYQKDWHERQHTHTHTERKK